MDKIPKKDVSINCSHAKFSHLDFLTLEDGTDTLSQNISKELLLSAVWELRRTQISLDNLVMQA